MDIYISIKKKPVGVPCVSHIRSFCVFLQGRNKLAAALRRGVLLLLADHATHSTGGGNPIDIEGGSESEEDGGKVGASSVLLLPRSKAASVTLFLNRMLGLPLLVHCIYVWIYRCI